MAASVRSSRRLPAGGRVGRLRGIDGLFRGLLRLSLWVVERAGQLYTADLGVRPAVVRLCEWVWAEPSCFDSALVDVDFGSEEDALPA